MYKFTKTDFVDVDKCEERLQNVQYILYDRERMISELNFYSAYTATLQDLAGGRMIYASGGHQWMLTREGIANYLMRYERCPSHYFNTRHTKGISIDKTKVLDKLRKNGYAEEFFDYYFEYTRWNSVCSRLRKLIDTCTILEGVHRDGVKLYRIPFSVNRQTNLRFNYKSFDIISEIPKELCDCISAPKGYFLVWGDFAQSDFRIAYNIFLRSRENDELMNQYEDKYEALARMVARENGEKFDVEKFTSERQLYKRLTLATMYGMRDSVVPEEQQFISAMTKFLYKSPRYVEYERRLRLRIELGLPIILTSYFGNTSSVNNNPAAKMSTLYETLNGPVQQGTSEIIILVINTILDMFRAEGLGEEDVNIYFNRHDEPIFLVKEEHLDNMWIFNQFTDIFVDSWSPLHMDFEFGYNYKVPDEKLGEAVRAVFEKNDGRIERFTAGTKQQDDDKFLPVPDVFMLSAAICKIGDGHTIAAFYSEPLNQVLYSIFDTEDMEQIQQCIRRKVHDAEPTLFQAGYRGILVYNGLFGMEEFVGESFINYKKCDDYRLVVAAKLCNYMSVRYCNKMGVKCPVSDPVFTDYDAWRSTLGSLDILAGNIDG